MNLHNHWQMPMLKTMRPCSPTPPDSPPPSPAAASPPPAGAPTSGLPSAAPVTQYLFSQPPYTPAGPSHGPYGAPPIAPAAGLQATNAAAFRTAPGPGPQSSLVRNAPAPGPSGAMGNFGRGGAQAPSPAIAPMAGLLYGGEPVQAPTPNGNGVVGQTPPPAPSNTTRALNTTNFTNPPPPGPLVCLGTRCLTLD